MTAILDAILDFLESSRGIGWGLLIYYSVYISGATMKISPCWVVFHAYNRCFCLNDGHFGRHIGYLGKLQMDCRGLLVCCSTNFSGPILKISACYERCPGFLTF